MSKPLASRDFQPANAKPLAGKVALVTGGSRGIGAAIAKELADQGADVAISYAASADRATAVTKQLQERGVRAAAFKADQADAKQVEDLVRKSPRNSAASIFSSTMPASSRAPPSTTPTPIRPRSRICSQ